MPKHVLELLRRRDRGGDDDADGEDGEDDYDCENDAEDDENTMLSRSIHMVGIISDFMKADCLPLVVCSLTTSLR